MRASLLFTLLCVPILFACNNDAKKNKKDTPPPAVTDTVPLPPVKSPDHVQTTPAEKKCYVNDGLKYKTTITITQGGDDLLGTIASEEIGSSRAEIIEFEGTKSGSQLKIHVKGSKPVVGDASEWTNKPWRLGTDKLYIVFNAKDYETGKWEETEYIFDEINCN